ncbi:hypothetical protein D3C74_397130 [compost metagenome]
MRVAPPEAGRISTCPVVSASLPASHEIDCEVSGVSVGVRMTRVGGATTTGASSATGVSEVRSK